MRSDTVAVAIAKKLHCKKSDLLSNSTNTKNKDMSMAVRMALGETHIILDTKVYTYI